MLPYGIIHTGMSVDGRLDWGGGPDNPYYELVQQLGAGTNVSGSNTMLKAFLPEDPLKAFGDAHTHWINLPDRPILAVVDRRGRIKNWNLIKKQPWWRVGFFDNGKLLILTNGFAKKASIPSC